MVSFDVTALFPNVPIEDALSLLKKWFEQHITDMDSVNSYVELTKMCMQDNYFQFNGHYYRQTFGIRMRNALSPFLANIFMADFETRLSKPQIFPKLWIRYVDDIFCVMKKNTIDQMLVIMNRRHNTIKFTHEVEDNETLCFQTCQQKSHIPHLPQTYGHFLIHSDGVSPQHSTQISSIQLHVSLPCHHTIPLRITTEVNEIKTIAKINGYSEEFVDCIDNKHKKKV
jgi:hypothetical protein